MKDWTHEWWEKYRKNYHLVTSTAVFDELKRGSKPHKQDAITLALTLPANRTDKKDRGNYSSLFQASAYATRSIWRRITPCIGIFT